MLFGLKTGGILFLGPSESPGELADEFDHLDGVLYIDRMTDSTKLVFEDEYLKHLTTHEAQDDLLV